MKEPKLDLGKRTSSACLHFLLIAVSTLMFTGWSQAANQVTQANHVHQVNQVNQANQASQPLTTIILVRHAEKQVVPPENKDPDLSMEGVARAQELARMFRGAGVNAIYATQYKRTQQTVKPLADKLSLPVTQVEARKTEELVKQIRAGEAGQTVFLAGHNNTVPEIIAAFGGPKLPLIPETEYDNLFILTVHHDGSVKLLKLKIGSGAPVMGQGMMSPP